MPAVSPRHLSDIASTPQKVIRSGAATSKASRGQSKSLS
jgi:hypothetical protein